MRDTRDEALRQAHETLAEEINRLSKETLREGMKTHPLPEGSNAGEGLESNGDLYIAKLSYDGGDFTADANVEVYDGGGNRVGRLTGWGNTIGKGTYPVSGTVKLNYPLHVIKNWRFTYILDSNVGGITIIWTGLGLEQIGVGVFRPIPPKGISIGGGYVQVP